MSQGWSLTVEELFYGIAPLCFLLIRHRRYWLWLLPICIFFTGMGLTAFLRVHPFYSLLDNYLFTINATFFGRCTEFFIGIWLAVQLAKGKLPFKARHLTYVSIPLIALCMVLMTIARGVAGYGLETPVGIAVNSLLLPVCIIMLFQGLITISVRNL